METKRLCTLCISVVLITFGILFIIGSPIFFKYIIRTQLVLSPGSKTFKPWMQIPMLLPMDFYLFNWVNPEEMNKAKPRFEQVGPYRFMMDLKKVNVSWNQNGTVTYKSQKFWYFSEKGTNGSMQANVTTINTPAVAASYMAKSWGFFTRSTFSMFLSRLYSNIYVTKPVEELLFKGYPDSLLQMSLLQDMFSEPNMPKWDKFGLFYKRNGTIDFEEFYNMGTGINSTFGKIYNWKSSNRFPFFEGECAKIQGSTGDSFDASKDTIKFFMPDVCRHLVLDFVGNVEVDGITGRKYVLQDRGLDNGTKFPENLCYNEGGNLPSGVFNLTSCRFGSPSFMSLPHFYKADPFYNGLVEGLHPDPKKHEFYVIVEPNTGIPLQVNVKLQLNMLLDTCPGISLFEDVPRFFFPMMWFQQKGFVPKDNLPSLKLLLSIPTIGLYCGIFLIIIGVILLIVLNVRVFKRKQYIKNLEENVPLKLEQRNGHEK